MHSVPSRTQFRFAVIRQDLLSSNSWIAKVDKKGNAYISCRDNMKEIKTSLHASGKQHVAFSTEAELETKYGSRFLHKMEEPQTYTGPALTPCFNLFLPSWGLSLTPEMRDGHPATWNSQVIFLQAPQEPLFTSLSFVIVESALNLESATYDDASVLPIASLDLRPGKKLWIVRRYGTDEELRQLVFQVVNQINGDRELMARALDADSSDTPFMLRVDGRNRQGIPYTLPFAVSLAESSPSASAHFVAPFTVES